MELKKLYKFLKIILNYQYRYVPTGESIDTWTVPLGWEVQKCELLINGLNQISYFENNLHSMVHSQDFFGTGKLKVSKIIFITIQIYPTQFHMSLLITEIIRDYV